MTFDTRRNTTLAPFDPEMARDITDHIPVDGDLRAFLAAVAGSSPYLKTLMQREMDWLPAMLDDPESAIADEFARLRLVTGPEVARELRIGKRRVALTTALCDLGGVWELEQVTQTLTDFADLAVQQAWAQAVGRELARGRIPGFAADHDPSDLGYFILAMGKMGAGELNYSSDIDLICLFDESRFDPSDFYQARSSLIKATKAMSATLNDLTEDGYVFRTDLRLRPDPAVTPVCMGIDAAERYYESLGRTWERAAYIKARVCAGDHAQGAAFLKSLTPFVWRKHLDFAAIEDAHNMRLRYREHKGTGGPITLPNHNMKLGRGSIREIEFFTQTRQIIAGGRDPELRVRGTVPGLAILAAKGWITQDTCDVLTDHYRAHRQIEHRLQMINDAQTHSLPQNDDGFARLGALCGLSPDQLRHDLFDRLAQVHELTEGFFAPSQTTKHDDSTRLSDQEYDIVSRWPTYPAFRSERAEAIFERLKPEFLSRLRTVANPTEALNAFDNFLQGLPTGVQLFSLFQANTHLIDLLIDILGTAPALSRHLAKNPQVLDAVIGGSFWDDWPGVDALAAELSTRLAALHDYERKLDTARRWGKEWHFRIGVHLLRGIIDATDASTQYADLAQAMLQGLWPAVIDEFSRKHGTPPGRGAVVLGMGSLGAGRLHATSDLDVIVIYDAMGVEASDGKRPLPARTYYARLTQALITAMTAPMAEGRLYEVDMRLRPSGNMGPVATSWDAFQSYQSNDAWVWEHLALTRARVVAGPQDLADEVEAFRRSILGERDAGHIAAALSKMRARIAAAKTDPHPWHVKTGGGRLQDIELFSQMGSLVAGRHERDVVSGLSACVALNMITDQDQVSLLDAYRLFWRLQVASKLLSEDRLDPDRSGIHGVEFLLRLTQCASLEDLQDNMNTCAARAATLIEAALPEPQEDTDERG